MSKLLQWTKVSYKYWTLEGEGIVVWVVFEGQPWIGTTYIIQTDILLSDIYSYTHFACPEVYLKMI